MNVENREGPHLLESEQLVSDIERGAGGSSIQSAGCRRFFNPWRLLACLVVVGSISMSSVHIANQIRLILLEARDSKIRYSEDEKHDGKTLLHGVYTVVDIIFLCSLLSSHLPSIYKIKMTKIFILPLFIFDTRLGPFKVNFDVIILLFTSGLESFLSPIRPPLPTKIELRSIGADVIRNRGIDVGRLKKENDVERRFILFKKMIIGSFLIEFGSIFYTIYAESCTADFEDLKYRLEFLGHVLGTYALLGPFGIYAVWTENYRHTSSQFLMTMISLYGILFFRYKTGCWSICWVLIPTLTHSISVYFYGWLLYRRAGVKDIKPNFLGSVTIFFQLTNIGLHLILNVAGIRSLCHHEDVGIARVVVAGAAAGLTLISFLALFWATWMENVDRILKWRKVSQVMVLILEPAVLIGVICGLSTDSFIWYLTAWFVSMHLSLPMLLFTAFYNYELVKFTMQTEQGVWAKYFCCMRFVNVFEKLMSCYEGVNTGFEWLAGKFGILDGNA